jgi:hypothetical protein
MSKNDKTIKVRSEKLVILLFVAFQVLVFLPALQNPIPWSDDWGYIYFANDSKQNIAHDALASGRPILGLVDQLAYQTEFILDNLVILQLFSISGLLLLQFAIFSKLKKNNFANPISILTPLALILIPGIQGYVYFLSCFPYSWACLLGFLSQSFINNRKPRQISLGCVLFIGSFLIYPAGAMFYFLSYLVDYLVRFRSGSTFRSNICHLFNVILKLAMCSAVSMLIAKVVSFFFGIKQAARIELLNSLENLIEKIVWVLSRLFVSEFRIFTVASPSPTNAAIEAILVFSLFFFFILKPFKGFTLNRTLNFGLLLLIPLLGALPNLLIRENQFEFRTLTSTYAMSLTLWAYCLYEILQSVFQSNRLNNRFTSDNSNRAVSLICISLVLFAVSHTQRDSKDLWVKPSLIRDQITDATLQSIEAKDKRSICMVISDQIYVPLDRLGIYSMQSDLVSGWVPEPYMKLQLERYTLSPDRQITIRRTNEECDPLAIVINYGDLESGN